MKKGILNILKSLTGVFIALLFLYITFRNKDFQGIIESIYNTKVIWLVFASISLLIVTFLRALRWKVLIENVGMKPKTLNVFLSLLIGYFVNSFTPKFGELFRCTTLQKSDNIPVSKNLGTVVTERIYDAIVLGVGVLVIFLIEFDRLYKLFADIFNGLLDSMVWKIVVLIVIVLMIFGVFYLIRIVRKKTQNSFIIRILNFIQEMVVSIKSTFKIKKYWLFVLLTVAIWSFLAVMNYFQLMALKETSNVSFYFAVVVLFIGGIGWALPAPGGIGTTHFFILQLFLVFGLSENIGLSYGLLSNALTFVLTVLFGLIAYAFYEIFKYRRKKTQIVPEK